MYEIHQQFSTKYALYPNKKVKKDYDNTLLERNLSSIVSGSALKIDFSKFLKINNSINFKVNTKMYFQTNGFIIPKSFRWNNYKMLFTMI